MLLVKSWELAHMTSQRQLTLCIEPNTVPGLHRHKILKLTI
jgi:hypothetical protein